MSNGSFISLQQAIDMTTSYRNQREKMLEPSYRDQGVLPTCETFDKTLVQQVLDQDQCVSFRVYFGMDNNKQVRTILVGVNADGKDILPEKSDAAAGEEGLIVDIAARCPPFCPPPSALNP